MIEWSEEMIRGLGVALNEATLLDVEMDTSSSTAVVTLQVLTLQVLTLPATEPAPEDSCVRLSLFPVGRIAVSVRRGFWNDEAAEVETVAVKDLSDVVRSFMGCDIYGWEFFDCGDEDFDRWADRLSLDWRSGADGLAHTLDLFQEGTDKGQRRHLDLRLWFDDMTISTASGRTIPVDEFIAGGRRWWDALYNRDPRTGGHGIIPMANQGGNSGM